MSEDISVTNLLEKLKKSREEVSSLVLTSSNSQTSEVTLDKSKNYPDKAGSTITDDSATSQLLRSYFNNPQQQSSHQSATEIAESIESRRNKRLSQRVNRVDNQSSIGVPSMDALHQQQAKKVHKYYDQLVKKQRQEED
ncbi:hypothetical protein RCL1_005282 [Eukaryota sp. TZLM3-RCL]